jgi:N-acetylneuraminic acid mutarotase
MWLLALVIVYCTNASAQTREWVWMGGPSYFDAYSTTLEVSVHGAKGTFAATNLPSVREGASTWTDKKGHLWLFGGEGSSTEDKYGSSNSGYLNDLWEFDPALNEWAWRGGSDTFPDNCPTLLQSGTNGYYVCGVSGQYGTKGKASTTNVPGGRQFAASWTDSSGNLWLFGGYGFDANHGLGYFNDLWKYNTTTYQWTWVGGSSTVPGSWEGPKGNYGTLGTPAAANFPGGRSGSAVCTDANSNLWLIGGYGEGSTVTSANWLNDVWKYVPASGLWVWMGGSNTNMSFGVYGTRGTANAANTPGARQDSACWVDKKNRLWLFGGMGLTAANNDNGVLNDLWLFDPATKLWTWEGGSNSPYEPALIGTKGMPSTNNIPSSRQRMARFTDASGNFWLFGGRGVDGTQVMNYAGAALNDLWEFNPTNGTWTWTSGTDPRSLSNQYMGVSGTYGILGVPDAANTPGGREQEAYWTDALGNFWLFSGYGTGAAGASWGYSPNDLWEYRLATSTTAVTAKPTFTVTGGNYTSTQKVGIEDTTAKAQIYYSTTAKASQPEWTPYTAPVEVSTSETLTAVAMAPGYLTSAVASATYELPAAAPVFNLPAGPYASATVKLTSTTAGATIYFTTDGSTPTKSSKVYSGQIAVTASETIKAIAVAKGYLTSAVSSATYAISAKAATTNQWTWVGGGSTAGGKGVYGTKGTGAAANTPGSRYDAMGWTDKSGNRWLFGGQGFDSAGKQGYLDDLWEYSATAGQWIWRGGHSSLPTSYPTAYHGVYGSKGVFAAANQPGSRAEAMAWSDASGNLWLFGGYGYDGSTSSNQIYLNDLWEYNTTKNQWAWIAGPDVTKCSQNNYTYTGCTQTGTYGTQGTASAKNTPGGRYYSATWTDGSGNLWLFGGEGPDADGADANRGLNELWRFNTTSKQWAWIGGNNTAGNEQGRPGEYGTLGTASSTNIPGARSQTNTWTDGSGNLWLFGGGGQDANGNWDNLDDLWTLNPKTLKWTWKGGHNIAPVAPTPTYAWPGIYGTLGVPGAKNLPGGRRQGLVWVDKSGNTWLFGGWGADGANNWSLLNDLWEWTPATGKWTWMAGNSTQLAIDHSGENYGYGRPGVYGAKGKAQAGNNPGSRHGAVQWRDASGAFWLFGGWGYDGAGKLGYLNDLWKFQPTAPAAKAAANDETEEEQ